MEWKPLVITDHKLKEDIRKFGSVPDAVQELFKNRKSDPLECEIACDAVLAQDPTNGLAHFYKAVLAQERGDYEAVLRYAKPITERTPLIFHAWQLRGMGELLHGDTEAARMSFMHYGHVQRNEGWPWCLIAMTYLMEEQIELALYTIDEVMKFEGIQDTRILLWVRALIEEKAGDVQSALTHLIELQMMSEGEMKDRSARQIHKLIFLQEELG